MKKSPYLCLWFDGNAKEAAEFYCSVFKDSKIQSANPLVVKFEVAGMEIMALNGGPNFKFNEAASIVVECDTQDEIDYYWDALTKDGKEDRCGWLKDTFGLSWQIVPSILGQLMNDPVKAPAVMAAFLKMKKFVIADLMNN